MADELDDLEVDEAPDGEQEPEQAPQATADQSLAYWRARAEKAERRVKRHSEFVKLQSEFPGVSEEDLQGVDIRHWKRIAARIAPQPAAAPESEPEAKIDPEVEAAARQFVKGAGGNGTTASAKLTFEEAEKLPWPELREKIAKGLVEGVTAPPK